MTEQELTDGERICAEATKGPWSPRLGSGNIVCTAIASDCPDCFDEFVGDCLPDWILVDAEVGHAPKDHRVNMEFITHARTYYPTALAEVRRLRGALEEIATAHQSYHEGPALDASSGTYDTGVVDGHRCAAKIARRALEGL